jgi:hypothetical protein
VRFVALLVFALGMTIWIGGYAETLLLHSPCFRLFGLAECVGPFGHDMMAIGALLALSGGLVLLTRRE